MRFVAALLAVLALAGCGSSNPGSHAVEQQIDPGDQRWADTTLLVLDDLPSGWQVSPPDADTADTPPDDCSALDMSDLVATGLAVSDFRHPDGLVATSSIEVYESTADAHESVARGNEAELTACFAEVSREQFAADPESADVTVEGMRLAEGDPPQFGEFARRFRVTFDYVYGGGGLTAYRPSAQEAERVSLVVDLVAFQRDRAVGVIWLGAAFGDPPPGVAENLARTLDARMTKDPLPGE